MASGWETLSIDDVPTQPDGPGPSAWKPLRHHFGISAFGVNAWVANAAGEAVIEEHDEVDEEGTGGHEELYLVTRGRATFTIDGETADAPAGTLVYVGDPQLRRKAVAEEPGTTVFAVGAAAGKAFEPSPWELRRVRA